jgi:hypothetical protein
VYGVPSQHIADSLECLSMERVHRITCAKCKTGITSKAGVPVGQEIACPKCKFKFRVAQPQEEVVEDFDVVDDDAFEVVEDEKPASKKAPAAAAKQAPKPKAKPPIEVEDEEDEEKPARKKKAVARDEDEDEEVEMPRAKKKAVARDEDDDEEEEKPKAKKKARVDDDDEDEPKPKRSRKRQAEEDEDEAEPRSAYGRLKKNIWVRIGVLAVLLATAGFLGYKLYLKRTQNTEDDEIAKTAARLEQEQRDFLARNPNLPNFQPKINPNFPKVQPKFNPNPMPKNVEPAPKLEIGIVVKPTAQFNASFPTEKSPGNQAFDNKPGIYKLFLSADGSRVAISNFANDDKKRIQIWDISGEPKKTADLKGNVLAFSPDGKRLVRRENFGARIVEVETDTSVGDLRFSEHFYFLSPDVLVEMHPSNDWTKAEKFKVSKYEASTGRELESFDAAEDDRVSIASPIKQNTEIVFAMPRAGKIGVSSLTTKNSVREFTYGTPDPKSFGWGIMSSSDGKWLSVNRDITGSTAILDGESGAEVMTIPKQLEFLNSQGRVSFLPNRNIIAGCSRLGNPPRNYAFVDMVAYDFVKKAVVATFKGHDAELERFAVSSDGRIMASGDKSGNVLIWNLEEIK